MPDRTEGSAAAVVRAADVMSAPVITVRPQTPVPAVADALTEHRIGGVPVVDESDAVLGVVSEYDLLAKSGATAGEVMTTAVVTVSEDTPIEDVRYLLVDRRIRRVPVLAAGRLVGIVSRSDVVALMATEWICEVCGEPVRGEHPPRACPKCHADSGRFVLQEQPPGA